MPTQARRLFNQLALQFELPFFSPSPPATPEVRPPAQDKKRLIQFGAQVVAYRLKRSRRRSIGFVIDEDGLVVTAPRWVTLADIDLALREKERWILLNLHEMEGRRRATRHVSWEDGGSVPYLGSPLILRTAPAGARGRDAVVLDQENNTLTVSLPPAAGAKQMRDRVQAWLQAEARRIFNERSAIYAARLGVTPKGLRLSSAKTRWGSCNADGKILLNWRLVHFPVSSIDYVVAHELAHLREMNHGPRFWQTVGEILPGFESARAHLAEPPAELLPVL
jgi:predicted metal-dependent hydrolase